MIGGLPCVLSRMCWSLHECRHAQPHQKKHMPPGHSHAALLPATWDCSGQTAAWPSSCIINMLCAAAGWSATGPHSDIFLGWPSRPTTSLWRPSGLCRLAEPGSPGGGGGALHPAAILLRRLMHTDAPGKLQVLICQPGAVPQSALPAHQEPCCRGCSAEGGLGRGCWQMACAGLVQQSSSC